MTIDVFETLMPISKNNFYVWQTDVEGQSLGARPMHQGAA